jgi:hypothetical protein
MEERAPSAGGVCRVFGVRRIALFDEACRPAHFAVWQHNGEKTVQQEKADDISPKEVYTESLKNDT